MTRDVMIVLVGKTGAGKSATGNTILGTADFKEDFRADSVTKTCKKKTAERDGRRVAVIDTAGIFDTSLSGDQLHREIEKCVKLSVPGPHVFLVVIRLGRFTAEERNAVKWIQKNFGEEAEKYTMLLFTGGDQLDKPIEEFVGSNNELREFLERFGHHVFNNKDRSDSTQVTELLAKIEEMVKRNGGRCYTNEMYKEAQRKIREEEEKKRQEDERKRREEERRMREEIEREMMEKERKRQEEERKKEEERRMKEEKEREMMEKERKRQEERKKEEEERRMKEEIERVMMEKNREIDNLRREKDRQIESLEKEKKDKEKAEEWERVRKQEVKELKCKIAKGAAEGAGALAVGAAVVAGTAEVAAVAVAGAVAAPVLGVLALGAGGYAVWQIYEKKKPVKQKPDFELKKES